MGFKAQLLRAAQYISVAIYPHVFRSVPFTQTSLAGIKSREMKSNQIQTRARKPQKMMIKKSLNSAFSSVHKDALVDSASDTIDSTPTVEISEDGLVSIDSENLLVENVNSPSLSASSKASMAVDLTPSSAITTDNSEFFVLDVDEMSDLCGLKHELPEVKMVGNYLKQARLQMLRSKDMELRSKMLLDALVEVTVKDFCSLRDERDWMDELLAAKSRILFVCVLMLFIASSVIFYWIRFGRGDSAYYHPPPT